MRRVSLFALAFLLAAATASTASRISATDSQPYDVGVIPTARALRWLSLGHTTLAANAYYLKLVQYIGEPRSNERGWEKLYPLANLVTDLDRRHGYAYQVAGIILGSVGRVAESNAILEKGTAIIPDRYILPYLRAFNAFYYDEDFVTAGRFAQIAASKSGAPAHVRQNVLAYYVKGRKPEIAISYLQNLLSEARDDDTRDALQQQLKQALVERDATIIEPAIESYRSAHGILPQSVQQLVAAGLLKAVPTDPFGGRYVIDSAGRIHSSVHTFRFSPPTHQIGHEPGVRPDTYEGMLR